MATWAQLKDYIRSNYRISDDYDDAIKLTFETDLGRTQSVLVRHVALLDGTEDWVAIESPFGELGQIDVAQAVRATDGMVCGGIGAAVGRFVTFRHAVPLANLDVNEFERPLLLVTSTADKLESEVSAGDRF
jgi:hypothetical protein